MPKISHDYLIVGLFTLILQKAVSANLYSKQILPFNFAWQNRLYLPSTAQLWVAYMKYLTTDHNFGIIITKYAIFCNVKIRN